jgi:molecular chaperone GrpE
MPKNKPFKNWPEQQKLSKKPQKNFSSAMNDNMTQNSTKTTNSDTDITQVPLVHKTPKQDTSKIEIAKLNQEISEIKAKLEIKEAEAKDWQNKAFRYVADLENSRKQQELEIAQVRKNTKKFLAKPLVEFLNNQYLALNFAKNSTDENAQKSFATIQISFDKLVLDLKGQGIDVLVPNVGEDFNPETMQSLNEVESQTHDHSVPIKHVVSIGLRADEQVIQPVMVML